MCGLALDTPFGGGKDAGHARSRCVDRNVMRWLYVSAHAAVRGAAYIRGGRSIALEALPVLTELSQFCAECPPGSLLFFFFLRSGSSVALENEYGPKSLSGVYDRTCVSCSAKFLFWSRRVADTYYASFVLAEMAYVRAVAAL